MNNHPSHTIRRSQKESLLLKEISKMFHHISLEDDQLFGLFINRVQLSTDKSLCTIYFFTPDGYNSFKEKLSILKLYKPSMRKGLAKVLNSRYVPDLKFDFDAKFEKQQKLDSIIDQVSKDLNQED